MPPDHSTTKITLSHFLFWVGFAIYEQSVLLFIGNPGLHIGQILLHYALNAALFYLNCNKLLPQFYAQSHYDRYVVSVLAALMVYGLLRTELYVHLFPSSSDPAMLLKNSYYRFGILSFYRGTFFLFISAGYWFARNALELERQRRRQEQQLLTADLAFLRSQINPHFLFNSLNFLYAQVYPHSVAAAKSILLLSDTMRYALHEDSGGKVMLEQEVQHLRNYISLHQLRYNHQLHVNFEVVGNVQFLMILPLVLITFVENCFKHGDLTDAAHPVLINLMVEHGQLRFQTRNKKRFGPKEISTGIGLVNTQRRLALAYPEYHCIRVADEHDYYTANLTIYL